MAIAVIVATGATEVTDRAALGLTDREVIAPAAIVPVAIVPVATARAATDRAVIGPVVIARVARVADPVRSGAAGRTSPRRPSCPSDPRPSD